MRFPRFSDEEVVSVTDTLVDGIKVMQLIDNNNESWINLETITKQHGYSKNAIRYHLYNLPKNLEGNIKYLVKRGKFFLFINRLVFNHLRYKVPRFVTSELIEKTAQLYTGLETGELKVVDKEGIEKLKEQLTQITQEITPKQLVELHTDVKLLLDDRKLTPQQKWIINRLISLYAVKFGFTSLSVWNEFSDRLAIQGYKDARFKMFVPFVEWFFEKDPKTVARVFNMYMKRRYQDSEIINVFLDILEGKTTALSTLKDFVEPEEEVA